VARSVDCYVGIGSNLGDRRGHIKEAVRLIRDRLGLITAKSFVYESPPWGSFEGETFPYLNAAVLVETKHTAEEVLKELQGIESVLGRRRSVINAPRTLDLDILYFGDTIIEKVDLKIPHPHLANRRFVLQPLHDIDPTFVHPFLGFTTKQLLENCNDPQQELTRV